MTKNTLGLAAILCTLALTGCGKSDSNIGSQAVVAAPVTANYIGGACGPEVVADYDALLDSCDRIGTAARADVCKTNAVNMLNKYPNMDCKAKMITASRRGRIIRITALKLQKVIAIVDANAAIRH